MFENWLIARSATQLAKTLAYFPGATGWAISHTHSAFRDVTTEDNLTENTLTGNTGTGAAQRKLAHLRWDNILPPETQALIITSPAVVEILPGLAHSTLPMYCVGAQTAQQIGAQVWAPTVQQLVPLLQASPQQFFAHLHGDQAPLAWHQTVGKTIQPVLTYHTHYTKQPPPMLTPAWLVCCSPKSAAHARQLFHTMGVDVTSLQALCLSQQIAAELAECRRLEISPTPDLVSLAQTANRIRNA